MPARGTVGLADIDITYLESGPADGPLALVLHGFPDSADSWGDTVDFLGALGFHAVAPWLRGYAPSSLPRDGVYQGGAYVRDATRLHQALGGDHRAVLIGHDIGAAIAYGAAAFGPNHWSRVITISVPDHTALQQMMTTYTQLRRSWYILMFQQPSAEAIIAADDLGLLDHLWADWSPGFHHPAAIEAAKTALRDPAHQSAALGWYRAVFHPEAYRAELAAEQGALASVPPQPWLYLHGELDGCVGADAARLVNGVIVAGAGHFPHLEQPEILRKELQGFLADANSRDDADRDRDDLG